MGGGTRVIARVDDEKYHRMKHRLLDDRITFSEWLRERMDEYLGEKTPKGKTRKGKGA